MTGCPGKPETLDEVDVFAADTIENWYPTYDLLRSECPVYHVPDTQTYFLTRYEDIYNVLRQTDLFRRGAGKSRPLITDKEAQDYFNENGWQKISVLGSNPPDHRRYRDMVDHFFSVKGAKKQTGLITDIAEQLIDNWIDDGEVEYVAQFAETLPAMVITVMMGFPLEDLPKLKIWSEAWVAPFSLQLDVEQEREVSRLMVEFQHYIHDHIKDRRENPRKDPTEDVVSYLVSTPVKLHSGTRMLNDTEIINMIDHLYIGGNETTTFALTSGLWILIENPELQDALASNPKQVRTFVEEVLRLESPTQGMDRHAVRDTEIAGVKIPKGSHIHMRYAAANRDKLQFNCPENIELGRKNASKHLAFSIGETHCPGAGLSRLEQNIATGLLLKKIKNFRFAEKKNTFQHHMNFTLRSFKDLHVTFEKR
ncbi:MAG: cytochrome P450 [Acidimicrobiales bacterium]|jgi:cytochrome P450|nr:cytochrome P450 [Acidimicrobiales bacterium]MDP6299050.1 cytochrome P450 [Acidimicrobiales bacterium]HJM28788.1 cytochrome P450 [Acidimicrobiales bacterium]HJM98182.1 cytochrome P450 [Acidimicrobiales bacterium]